VTAVSIHDGTRAGGVRLKRSAQQIAAASPRVQRLCAFAAGTLSILAMAPFHFWPILWLTLPLLLLTLDAAAAGPVRTSRWAPWRRTAIGRASESGWWFGFGYHLVGLFWIGEAFLIEAEVFAWLLPIAVTLMPAGLALFTALTSAAVQAIGGASASRRVLMLAIAFGVSEWLRGHIFTGFPWNVLGYALTWPLALMQSASLLGIYGLTVVTVLVFASPYVAVARNGPASRTFSLALLAGPLVLICMFVFGHWRLASHVIADATEARSTKIRVVQASIPQRDRLDPSNVRRIFDQHLALSQTAFNGVLDDAEGIDVIIWPEAAMPFLPLEQPVALAEIGTLLGSASSGGTRRLITGALRASPSTRFGGRDIYNSLLVFEGGAPARHIGTYDKIHLVPFGEYLPAQSVLEKIGLQQLTRQRGGFAAGPGPRRTLSVEGIGRILPLICYEVIFPDLLPSSAERPALLLTLTNDGWFGTSTGPRQHYHQGRVRAVETGVPLLRASSNGISAMVDPLGRERARLELNQIGTFDTALPKSLTPSLYARWGDWIFGILLLFLVIVWLADNHHQPSTT
jgi:apolipoprotein N-acyltransferase